MVGNSSVIMLETLLNQHNNMEMDMESTFYWFSREARLIRCYRALLADGPRWTPGMLLKNRSRPVGIRSAPTADHPYWTVVDGKEVWDVETSDIEELSAARWLAGYD